MDIQLKRGMLDACVLSVLDKGDSYGYQMIKDISPGVDISESTLYPILKRLESGNFIVFYTMEHNGRLRKYYRITDAGRRRLDEFVNEWQEVIKVYNFIISGRGGTL